MRRRVGSAARAGAAATRLGTSISGVSRISSRRGPNFLGRGGGAGTPFQKLKTHRIWFTIFWVGPQIQNNK